MAQAALKFTGSRMANPSMAMAAYREAGEFTMTVNGKSKTRFFESTDDAYANSYGFDYRLLSDVTKYGSPVKFTKTRAIVAVDEGADGKPITESWAIRGLKFYNTNPDKKTAIRKANPSMKTYNFSANGQDFGNYKAASLTAAKTKFAHDAGYRSWSYMVSEAEEHGGNNIEINELTGGGGFVKRNPRKANPSMKTYNFSANGQDFGNYKAASLTAAKTKFAHDAGYRSWSYMVSEAEEHGGNNIEINELTGGGGFVKRNPDKSKPRAYVRRVSQATGAPPSKRLTARRKMALEAPAGYFPNPKSKRTYTVYWELPHSANSTILGVFFSLEKAKQYARAHAKLYPSHYVRVESRG